MGTSANGKKYVFFAFYLFKYLPTTIDMAIEKFHQEKLAALQQFYLKNGHCYVYISEEYSDLYDWIQRIKQNRYRLSEDLIAALEAMNFDWRMYDSP